ncbi:MAG: hypothetical protein WEG40_20510 [Candidatus Rokuibacteriota bacterium]
MVVPSVDLHLPAGERRLAAGLAGAWRDVLYAPGPGFTSPLDPGAYRSSFVIVPVEGAAVRLSSLVTPAFGGELCRLRLEPLDHYRPETFGSFFKPSRAGTVYAFTPDRSGGAARAPARPDWRYDGPPLGDRLGRVHDVRVLRERGRHGEYSWEADRGIAVTAGAGGACLLLSVADSPDAALFVPGPGLYRTLLDPAAPGAPGATVRELLGYGEWPADLDLTVELLPVRTSGTLGRGGVR